MRPKRAVFLLFLALHLLVILAVCVKSTVANYTGFYQVTPAKPLQYVMQSATAVSDMAGIYHYSVVAGIDAGYGFFAPNVASEYVLTFDCYTGDSTLLYRQSLPVLNQRESTTRYITMLGSFQDKLVAMLDGEDASSFKQRHLNAIVRSMAMNILDKDRSMDHIRAVLYLYDFPSLADSRHTQPQSRLIEVETFDIYRQ